MKINDDDHGLGGFSKSDDDTCALLICLFH